MRTINLKTNWKEVEKANTLLEIQRLKDAGMEQITLNEYRNMLLELGLKLKLSGDYVLKYYNTMNEHHYLECTTTAVDQTGHSFCNIKSKVYYSPLMMERIRKFRQTYFTTLKSGHILTI